MTITIFAPSPIRNLHIGGERTVSITRTVNSSSIDQTISLISKEVVLNRILKTIRYIA